MSQSTPSERTIDGYTYRVYKLPPLDAHDVLVDLSTTVLPSIGNLFAGMLGGGQGPDAKQAETLWDVLDSSGNPEQFAEAFRSLASALGSNKPLFRELIEKLARLTEVVQTDGKSPRLNAVMAQHFMGDLPGMYKWFAFALEVQFGNFFEMLPGGTNLGDLLKKAS